MKIEEFIEIDKETGTQNLFYCWYPVYLHFFFGPYQEIYLIFKTLVCVVVSNSCDITWSLWPESTPANRCDVCTCADI